METKHLRAQTTRGTLYVMLSALLFGVLPIVAKWTYAGGSNSVNMTFLRSFLPLPILAVLAWRQGGTLKIPASSVLPVLTAGVFMNVTTLLLYTSYTFIAVGTATTLHFIYPLAVAVIAAALGRGRIDRRQGIGLLLGVGGISVFLLESDGGSLNGIALALLSGVSYALYMLIADTPKLKSIPCFLLSLHLSTVASLVSGSYGLATGQLTLSLTPLAWVYSMIVALGVTVGAVVLMQAGIRLCGAPRAALLSLLEPITSVVLGVLLLGDVLTLPKGIGCGMILSGLLFVTLVRQR